MLRDKGIRDRRDAHAEEDGDNPALRDVAHYAIGWSAARVGVRSAVAPGVQAEETKLWQPQRLSRLPQELLIVARAFDATAFAAGRVGASGIIARAAGGFTVAGFDALHFGNDTPLRYRCQVCVVRFKHVAPSRINPSLKKAAARPYRRIDACR